MNQEEEEYGSIKYETKQKIKLESDFDIKSSSFKKQSLVFGREESHLLINNDKKSSKHKNYDGKGNQF